MTFRELRERHGFESGARLAKLAGVDQTTISHLDAGKVKDPRISTLERIAETLGVTTGAVMRAIRETIKEAA
jgi:transcriptional regulator with XRE-family HTH domain